MHVSANNVNREFLGLVKHPEPWPPKEEFWDRLSRLQRGLEVGNGEIARVAGVSIGTVSAWRRRKPDAAALARLAAYFGVTAQWLLTGEGSPTNVGRSKSG